jgi:hypothetical protein
VELPPTTQPLPRPTRWRSPTGGRIPGRRELLHGGKEEGGDDDDLHGAHLREASIRPTGISTGEEHGVRVSSLRRAALLAPLPCVLAELAVGFVVHVASVCPTCFRCLTRMLREFRADVAKVDLDFSTLRVLIPNTNV